MPAKIAGLAARHRSGCPRCREPSAPGFCLAGRRASARPVIRGIPVYLVAVPESRRESGVHGGALAIASRNGVLGQDLAASTSAN